MVIKKIDMEEYSVRFDDRSFDVRRCFRIRIYHADKPEFCDLVQIDDKFYDAKDLKDMADACWFALEKMKRGERAASSQVHGNKRERERGEKPDEQEPRSTQLHKPPCLSRDKGKLPSGRSRPANPVRKNRVLLKPSKHVTRRRKIFW